MKAALKTEKAQHAALRAVHTKLETKLEAEKEKKLEAKCKAAQTKLAQAEARIAVLQVQLAARPPAPLARQSAPALQTDLSPFLTKALDHVKPDYSGLASLLTAARPAAQEVTRAGSASVKPTYSFAQLMEIKTLFKQ